MERFDSLEIFAEIGIALAGFSGVAAAIAGRSTVGLLPRQRPGFWSVIACGLAAAMGALIPQAVSNFGVAELTVWRVGCLAFAILFVIAWVVLWRYHQRLNREGTPSPFARAYPISGVIVAALALSLLLAATGLLSAFAAYYMALVATIGFAANSFILFLLVPPPK